MTIKVHNWSADHGVCSYVHRRLMLLIDFTELNIAKYRIHGEKQIFQGHKFDLTCYDCCRFMADVILVYHL